MKKTILGAFVLAILGIAVARPAQAEVVLYADQDIPVGTVGVAYDAGENEVTVTLTITDLEWYMTQSQVHIFTDNSDWTDITLKNGNPPPGQFMSKHKGLHTHTDDHVIDLDGLDPVPGAGAEIFLAAHTKVIRPIEDCWDAVWQVGDVETIDPVTSQLTCYYDELNYSGPVAPVWPPFADPFVIATNLDNEFPWNSSTFAGYAADFNVDWDGGLPFGGRVVLSWSPGKSASETKIVTSLDGGETATFHEAGGTSPTGWLGYKLVESMLSLDPIESGSHSLRFQHTTGDGTLWDWVLLEKPCLQEESGWAADDTTPLNFPGSNWATYVFAGTLEEVCAWDVTGDWGWRFMFNDQIPYNHDMDVTVHQWDTTGDFVGVGGYPAGGPYSITWVVTGNVDGDDVEFFIDYDGSGYWVDAEGIIAPDGTMTGTACTSSQGCGHTWLTTSGEATRRCTLQLVAPTP
ncbi:MAG: hypothetical protein PVJ86_12225 [Phycisphaerales bacterium]|jgi:hypothetical protein